MAVIGCCLAGITGLLIVEYRFFNAEAHKMIALQEDYHNHLIAVNRVLEEYNKTKERLEELQETGSQQKKKIISDADALCSNCFPQGAKVYSSDDIACDDQDTLLTINRDLEYLKQSTVDYIKKQRLGMMLQRMNFDDYQEYTNQVIAQRTQQKSTTKKKQRKKIARARSIDTIAREYNATISDMNFMWPIDRSNFWLSSHFGPRRKSNGTPGFHYGIDMAAVKGTPVRAASSGVVIEAQNVKGYGKTVVIAHNHKYRTRYAHLSSIAVRMGQAVNGGQLIGRVGATGAVRSKHGRNGGSHLHFEVSAYGKKVNPLYFLG